MLEFVCTEKQLADIFTKPLCDKRFSAIRIELSMVDFSEIVWHFVLNVWICEKLMLWYLSKLFLDLFNFLITIIFFFFVKIIFLKQNLSVYFIFINEKLFWKFIYIFAIKLGSKLFVLSVLYRIGVFEILTNFIAKCI